MKLDDITVDHVKKAYRGLRGCMCGCLGTYSYHQNTPHADWQGEVSHRGITSALKTLQSLPNVKWQRDGDQFLVDGDNIPADALCVFANYVTDAGVDKTVVVYLND